MIRISAEALVSRLDLSNHLARIYRSSCCGLVVSNNPLHA